MKVLIVAATEAETHALRRQLEGRTDILRPDFLHTGIGMVAMAYSLTRRLSEQSYDLLVNAGVAGAIDPALPIGAVVAVTGDHLYELGAQDGDRFLTFDEIGLQANDRIVPARFYLPKMLSIPLVEGITVNTVHGQDEAIQRLRSRSSAAIESMEGAAFYHACNGFDVDCIQIRAVSNKVERRNRDSWNLPLAIGNLTDTVIHLLQSLSRHA